MVAGVLTLHGRKRAIIIALLLGAFASLAVALPDKGGMAFDVTVMTWLQAHATDGGEILFTWISWLGDTALGGLLLAAVFILAFRRRWYAAATVTLASIAAPLIDIALKPIFHRGRPDFALELITGPTWSFPSGHSMSSLVGFGIVAFFRLEHERHPRRRLAIIVSTSLVVAAVGFSRVYLGVHYVSDVAGGWLAGSVWLLVAIEAYHLMSYRRGRAGNALVDLADGAVPPGA